MRAYLFRQEALEFQQERLLGEVMLAGPLSFAVLTGLAVLLATAVVAFAYWGEYTRKAHVSGYLAPSSGLIKVYAPEVGTLVEKYVAEGQEVQEGQKLFVISTERTSRANAAVRAAAIAQLKQRKDSLIDELSKQQHIDTLEKQSLGDRIRGLEAEHTQLLAELTTQQDKLANASTTAHRYRELGKKKFVAEQQIREKFTDLLTEKGRLQSMQRQRLELEREVKGLRSQLGSTDLKARNQRAAIERNISSVEQELTEYEAQRALVITAPGPGKVTAILAEPGQSTTTTQPLLSILPSGSTLEAQLLVPSRAIGFIVPQQTVAVRYQAFPYQRFGSHHGHIKTIAKTLITPSDAGNSPVPLPESVYRITAELESQSIEAYGKDVPLQSGMLFDADIWLDHRRLYEWLLEPLYSLSGRL